MRSTRLVIALATVAAALSAGPATSSDPTRIAGSSCGSDLVEDATAESGDVLTGSMYGGPIYAGSEARPVTGVYLICTLQVGAENSTHAGADAASAATWGVGPTSVLPGSVSILAPVGVEVYQCSEVWIDTNDGHVTLFLNALTQTFDPSPFVDCALLNGTGTEAPAGMLIDFSCPLDLPFPEPLHGALGQNITCADAIEAAITTRSSLHAPSVAVSGVIDS